MSIVNDALKKARKEFEVKDLRTAGPILETARGADKRWTAVIVISLFIIASLFGSLILYKNMSGPNSAAPADSVNTVQSALNSIEQKVSIRPIKARDIVKLDGIMYGDKGKWAIVNDRIVKEGDSLLGGEITLISRDNVKIQKTDGSEIILGLKQ
ncbi:MAG: hypothetical protein Q8O12_04930 [Candidatus Omnitrophota bacterium]|nr:hypothetical protein [Candidatus Omnitrophota bacterium]